MRINELILLVFFGSQVAYAGYNDRGFPCVKDICVDDQLIEKISLPWEPVDLSPIAKLIKAQNGEAYYDEIPNILRSHHFANGSDSFLKHLALISFVNKFDGKTISSLKSDEGVICSPSFSLTGTFNSISGLPTYVGARPIAGKADSGKYVSGLVVTVIRRCYPQQNPDSVFKALSVEYPDIKRTQGGFATFSSSDTSCGGSPSLVLKAMFEPTKQAIFDKVPECQRLFGKTKPDGKTKLE